MSLHLCYCPFPLFHPFFCLTPLPNSSLPSLGFSVTVFCVEALLAIAILLLRRNDPVGGELGGPKIFKTISSALFVFFWCAVGRLLVSCSSRRAAVLWTAGGLLVDCWLTAG